VCTSAHSEDKVKSRLVSDVYGLFMFLKSCHFELDFLFKTKLDFTCMKSLEK